MNLIQVHTCTTPQSPGLEYVKSFPNVRRILIRGSIVYIHGITSSASEKQSGAWKENLPLLAPPNTNIWAYDLQTELGDQFETVPFLEKSKKLLNSVYQLHQDIKVRVLSHFILLHLYLFCTL